MVLTPSTYLSASCFEDKNSSRTLQEPHPWDVFTSDHIYLKDGWYFQGWCNASECDIIRKDDRDYVFMFFSPEGESVWFHISKTLAQVLVIREEQILQGAL